MLHQDKSSNEKLSHQLNLDKIQLTNILQKTKGYNHYE